MQSSSNAGDTSGVFEISRRLNPARILLAEDDHEFRRFLSEALRREGYEVIEACTGLELRRLVESMVLHSAGNVEVELVIADIRMPGATGLGVVSELRQSDWNTPVILISAFVQDEVSAEAARLGAVLLEKPFDLQELLWFVGQNTGNS